MEVVEQVSQVREAVAAARRAGQAIRFVPTMGALHAGHVSLMDAARADGGYVVVSIFVNPTQFAPHEDLQRYPRPKDQDLALCRAAGVDLVLYPSVAEMYPPGATTFVQVEGLSSIWEGAIRPEHFRGVATVVTKLFHIVSPDVAYFGQKDYQQQVVIRKMVQDLNQPVGIRTCPTLRDADGLAMSSRNAYLSPAERTAGLSLSQALQQAEQHLHHGERDPRKLAELMRKHIQQTPGARLDYAVVVDPGTLTELDAPQAEMVALVAARVGTTRLIDNAIWRV
jgi:pantoate--beta-alanine ligase